MGQPRSEHRLAEEDRCESAIAKDFDLFLIEHIDLGSQGKGILRFIGSEFEDAWRAFLIGRRDFDFGMRLEGLEQYGLIASVWQITTGLVRLPCLNELFVGTYPLGS